MSDFGPRSTEMGQVGVASTVKAPVQGQNAGLKAIASVFDTAVKGVSSNLGAGQAREANQALVTYQEEYMNVIEAARQGEIPRRAAMSRLNQLLISYSNDNPALAKEFRGISKDLSGNAGFGGFLQEDTRLEKEINLMRDSLIRESRISPGASDEEVRMAWSEKAQAEASLRAYNDRIRIIDEELKDINLNNQRRTAKEAERSYMVKESLIVSQPANQREFNTTLQTIITTNMPVEEKLNRLEDLWSQFSSGSQVALSQVNDSTFQSAYMKPYEGLYERAKSVIKGETTVEALEAQIAFETAHVQSGLASNEDLMWLRSTTDFLGDFAQTGPGGTMISTMWSETLRDILDPSKRVKIDTPNLGGVMEDVVNLTPTTPKGKEDQAKAVESALEEIALSETEIANNASVIAGDLDFIANPKFLALTRQENFDQAAREKAHSTIQNHYEGQLFNLIQREFDQGTVISGVQYGIMGGVDSGSEPVVVEVPDAVGFRSTEGGINFYAIDKTSEVARKEAERLNKFLKPVIDTSVKAFSHLEGHTNYKAMFDNLYEKYFLENPDSMNAEPDPNKTELNLSDFKRGNAVFDSMSTGGYISQADYENMETPMDLANAFVGLDEQAHNDILSSFFETTMGKKINPETTAWCAAFANGVLQSFGVQGTGKLTARSFLKWGRGVSLGNAMEGDVVVLQRGTESWQGHVGFYAGEQGDSIYILGGNQGDKVTIQRYPKSKVLGVRRGRPNV